MKKRDELEEGRRSGIITLVTDFGERDPFVGVMKGVILGRFGAARIVDLTHQIDVFAPAAAGFWLERAYRWFPRGTVHVAVVDPGVGTSRGILAAEVDGHVFLAPDNGLLAPVFASATEGAPVIVKVELVKLATLFALPKPSATFHGRDVFAPIAAELAADRVWMEELGAQRLDVASVVPSPLAEPVVQGGTISGAVVTIDHFGNALTNVRAKLVAKLAKPVVSVAGRDVRIVKTYGEAAKGELVALVGSFDVLEVSVVEGSAAKTLALAPGAPVVIREA
ncbi:SAM-dependent chlorinase/fluorinase [Myxococcota bacterium]|nr:SAM-dependent chlorinase/fluorinase [Myxococcota bacterium]